VFQLGLLPINIFNRLFSKKIFEINRLIFADHENCRNQRLAVVIVRKMKQDRKGDDDDDAVHKLCSQRYRVQAVKLTL